MAPLDVPLSDQCSRLSQGLGFGRKVVVQGPGQADLGDRSPSRWFTPTVATPAPTPTPIVIGTVTTLAGSTAGNKDGTGA